MVFHAVLYFFFLCGTLAHTTLSAKNFSPRRWVQFLGKRALLREMVDVVCQ